MPVIPTLETPALQTILELDEKDPGFLDALKCISSGEAPSIQGLIEKDAIAAHTTQVIHFGRLLKSCRSLESNLDALRIAVDRSRVQVSSIKHGRKTEWKSTSGLFQALKHDELRLEVARHLRARWTLSEEESKSLSSPWTPPTDSDDSSIQQIDPICIPALSKAIHIKEECERSSHIPLCRTILQSVEPNIQHGRTKISRWLHYASQLLLSQKLDVVQIGLERLADDVAVSPSWISNLGKALESITLALALLQGTDSFQSWCDEYVRCRRGALVDRWDAFRSEVLTGKDDLRSVADTMALMQRSAVEERDVLASLFGETSRIYPVGWPGELSEGLANILVSAGISLSSPDKLCESAKRLPSKPITRRASSIRDASVLDRIYEMTEAMTAVFVNPLRTVTRRAILQVFPRVEKLITVIELMTSAEAAICQVLRDGATLLDCLNEMKTETLLRTMEALHEAMTNSEGSYNQALCALDERAEVLLDQFVEAIRLFKANGGELKIDLANVMMPAFRQLCEQHFGHQGSPASFINTYERVQVELHKLGCEPVIQGMIDQLSEAQRGQFNQLVASEKRAVLERCNLFRLQSLVAKRQRVPANEISKLLVALKSPVLIATVLTNADRQQSLEDEVIGHIKEFYQRIRETAGEGSGGDGNVGLEWPKVDEIQWNKGPY